jgi:RNA recognition motif-containing protein
MSIRLYIGNLPEELDRQELASVFAEAGDSVSTKVITDRKTGKCRGFGFVTVKTPEQADQLIEQFNGYQFKDNVLKIEKALPRAKGKGEEEGGSAEDAPENAQQQAPVDRDRPSRRKSNQNQKAKRSQNPKVVTESDAAQPDPRWAQELEKLKQLLATQTTNS